MSKVLDNQYIPDSVSMPGEILLETIESLGMSQADLSDRMGRSPAKISEIINGRIEITTDTALQLERVLGVPASLWVNLQRNYYEFTARQQEKVRLEFHLEWLNLFPIHAMARLGWIDKVKDPVDQIRILLNYFGVASPERWHDIWQSPAVAYRKSKTFENKPGAVAAWLRQGELSAQRITCEDYDATAFKTALQSLRGMTNDSPAVFCDAMSVLCAKAGVAVVFVHELPGAPVSGATKWLTPKKALMQLTIRHKTDDHLWFTFFHESMHILHHGKKDIFIEDGEADAQEIEANTLAGNLLIPSHELNKLRQGRLDESSIMAFSNRIGIAPGIVVGRLQHERVIPFCRFNSLKRHFEWCKS